MAGHVYMDGCFIGPREKPEYDNESTPFAAGQLGKEVALADPTNSGFLYPKIWKYVLRKAGGAAINDPYSVVAYASYADAIAFSFGADAATTVKAGIFHGDDNATNVNVRGVQVGNYGWIQVGGVSIVRCGAGVAVGDALASQDDGTVDTAVAGKPVIGVALSATDTPLTGHCYILLDVPRISR